ncbi:MAG: TetR/AcrR family transcriptional regulator [Pseudomonadota bacterium]
MPRPRSFDETKVLQCAMLTFWRLGYDATTYKELEKITGVGVRSMHNTFGEKDELFLRSLRMYQEAARAIIEEMFNPPSVAAVERLFGSIVDPKPDDDITRSGCLVVNSVFELSEIPSAVDEQIKAYREMWRATFEAALVADGISDQKIRAEFLVGTLWGMLSQIRLARDTTAAAPMALIAIQTIRSWSTG